MQMLQLGYTIHEKKDFIPEFLPHLFFGHHGIFQHIMQQTRSNGFLVQFQLCQNDCHTERMDNICLSGFTHLSFVRLKSDMICFSINVISVEGWYFRILAISSSYKSSGLENS